MIDWEGKHPPTWKQDHLLSLSYLASPVLAFGLGFPALLLIKSPLWWVSIPHFIGLLAAPGYVYAWTDLWRERASAPLTTGWLVASLRLAIVASTSGIVLSLASGVWLATPFAALTTWQCVVLLRRLRHFRTVTA